MNGYLIGAGALLTAGPESSIAGATLHAQTDPGIATQVEAAAIDFEAADASEVSRILVMAAGWDGSRFRAEVVASLLARRECGLADVLQVLCGAVGTSVVHLFARWLPDEAMLCDLRSAGIRVVAHPLEAIDQAALVSGQRFSRWRSPFRAA